jgi:methylisocitrate lyase
MPETSSPGVRFRRALEVEQPLQVAGATNALHARLAQRVGYRALYLSGGGVAAASLGVPDIGITTLDDVLVDARRITDASDLPLLVDADTGFGGTLGIARTVRALIKAGAAAMHIEDQVEDKRCGHLPGKQLVPSREMVDRVKAAVDARSDPGFVVMARTDAFAVEGLQAAIDRAVACVDAGADMIFPEALGDLEQYRRFATAVRVPVLANLTEFGKTPFFTLQELRSAGVALALYPLSAFRAMNKAALRVYETIRREGSQRSVVDSMQTRAELYEALDYDSYQQRLERPGSKRRKP